MILRILFICAKGFWPFALPLLCVHGGSGPDLPGEWGVGDGLGMIDHLYLTSNKVPPDRLHLDDEGTSFDPATAGERELCHELSANSLFFLLSGPAAGGCDTSHSSNDPVYPVILSKVPLPHSTIRYRTCERTY